MSKSCKGEKGKGRGAAWSDDETDYLLNIWIEQSIEEQLEDTKVNSQRIYVSVSSDMKENGYDRTPAKCKTRMHTLKRNFRQCNNVMYQSGE